MRGVKEGGGGRGGVRGVEEGGGRLKRGEGG